MGNKGVMGGMGFNVLNLKHTGMLGIVLKSITATK